MIPAKKDALESGIAVKVRFTFEAQMDGDLSVHEGEIVTVVEMANEDWVNVKNKNGLIGLCPREYLNSVSEHSSDSLQESNLEEFEDFVLIRHKEANTVVHEEEKPKRMSQPHRPAPPAPAPGRVPLQREAIVNGEVSAQETETLENEPAISNPIDVKQKRADQTKCNIGISYNREGICSRFKADVRDVQLT